MATRRFRKVVWAGGTFAVALGIGFAMQNGDALAARFGSDPTRADAPMVPPATGLRVTAAAPGISTVGGSLAHHEGARRPATPELVRAANPVPPAAPAGRPPADLPVLQAPTPVDDARTAPIETRDEAGRCVPDLAATATAGAMVELVLSAPCASRSVAVIHHRGMMVSLLTDAAGEAQASVPALSPRAVFVAQVGSLPGATAVVDVPEVAGFERAVLQWRGELGLGLRALENGHGYSDGGHLWVGPERTVETALAGGGGFVSSLGDRGVPAGYRAEIYSQPAGSAPVTLDVEAAVTPATCGREIAAQTIQVTPDEAPMARDLSLSIPDCTAVGEYLVLSNLLRDLTLAMR